MRNSTLCKRANWAEKDAIHTIDSNGVNFTFWLASMSVGDYIHIVNREDTSLFGIYKLESIFTPLISIDKQKATLSKVAGPLSIVNSTNIEYNIANYIFRPDANMFIQFRDCFFYYSC